MRLLAIALLLSACTRFATFHPATRPVEDRAGAPDRAVAALVGMGYTIDTQSGGAVTSTWFEAKNDIGEVFMLRWAVTLTAWEVTVDLQCNRGKVGGDPCGDGRPQTQDWDARAVEIAKATAGE